MAKTQLGRTAGKWLAGAVLGLLAYAGLQYHAMLRDMDRAAALYGQGSLEEALTTYEGVESRLRAHGAMRLVPSGDRQTLLLNQARLLYALNRYDEAIERLQREDDISGVATDGRFFLLRGNITFRRAMQEYRKPSNAPTVTPGNLGESLNLLREGLISAGDSYRESLQINPNDWDAKYNYEYVEKMQKDLAGSLEGNTKILQEELPPTEALPAEQVG
jgi:tetratricopeptide (TPR) repeat protein